MRNIYAKFCVILLLLSNTSHAIEDSLLKSIEISASGNRFQAERLKIAAENLANDNSTSDKPGGKPYQRKVVYATNIYNKKLKTRLVKVKKFGVDNTPFKVKYDPNHSAADKEGYVKLPNVDKIIEKADSIEAQRSYEANLSMIETSRSMLEKTIDAMR